jgi:hypothetical protein
MERKLLFAREILPSLRLVKKICLIFLIFLFGPCLVGEIRQ